MKICLISPLMSKANIRPFKNLVTIIKAISKDLIILKVFDINISNIIPNYDKYEVSISHKNGKTRISSIYYYIYTQIKISKKIFQNRQNEIFIFYLCNFQLIPLLLTKILNKKTFLILGSSPHETGDYYKFLKLITKVNMELSDTIILYSPGLIEKWDLKRYEKKIKIAHEHYLSNNFKLINKIEDRDINIGFIGRFSSEKGILNFIKSIKLLPSDYNFFIVGEGILENKIKKYVLNENIKNVNFYKWIPNEELPIILNKLKLLVIPSYTEGLPNIMLESMACGTPVLCTKVGSVPDTIKNNYNGFLLENNNPEEIANKIIKSLNNPNLNLISYNSIKTIESNFTLEKEIELHENALKEALNEK